MPIVLSILELLNFIDEAINSVVYLVRLWPFIYFNLK